MAPVITNMTHLNNNNIIPGELSVMFQGVSILTFLRFSTFWIQSELTVWYFCFLFYWYELLDFGSDQNWRRDIFVFYSIVKNVLDFGSDQNWRCDILVFYSIGMNVLDFGSDQNWRCDIFVFYSTGMNVLDFGSDQNWLCDIFVFHTPVFKTGRIMVYQCPTVRPSVSHVAL